MAPSDLAWWAWLLIAIGCGAVGAGLLTAAVNVHDETKHVLTLKASPYGYFLGAVLGIPGAVCIVVAPIAFIIAMIRFVKWVWGS